MVIHENIPKFEFSNIMYFHNYRKKGVEDGFKGKGKKALVVDIKELHYRRVENLLKQVVPECDVHKYMITGNDMHGAIDYALDNGIKYVIVSLDLKGGRIDDHPRYAEFKEKCLLFASAGNKYDNTLRLPAAHPDSISVTEAEYFPTLKEKIYIKKRTENTMVDLINFGGFWTDDGYFAGTSSSNPYQAGMMIIFDSVYTYKYGCEPTKPEILAYMFANLKDIGKAGYDISSGHGFFKLDRNINRLRYIWSSKQKRYICKDTFLERAGIKNRNLT